MIHETASDVDNHNLERSISVGIGSLAAGLSLPDGELVGCMNNTALNNKQSLDDMRAVIRFGNSSQQS